MLIKAGVSIRRLGRPCRRTLSKLASLYKSVGQEITITSTFEGNHGEGSLHYCDDAFDIRKIRNLEDEEQKKEIQRLLGPDFDIVVKSNHVHIEYDPKG